jgi:hypothetical protein
VLLDNNPFNLIERDLIIAAIAKLCGARSVMRRHLLRVHAADVAGKAAPVPKMRGEEPGLARGGVPAVRLNLMNS